MELMWIIILHHEVVFVINLHYDEKPWKKESFIHQNRNNSSTKNKTWSSNKIQAGKNQKQRKRPPENFEKILIYSKPKDKFQIRKKKKDKQTCTNQKFKNMK